MQTVYLVRHGDKVKEAGDVPLTKLGQQQAELTGKYLNKFPIDLIISSPSKRTRQTAKIISQITGSPISISKKLRERINFGEIPNQSWYDYMRLCNLSSLNRDFVLPTGESSIRCGNRLESVIKSIQKLPPKNIVIVGHQGIFADYIRNIFSDNKILAVCPHFFSRREQSFSNCSISTIEIKNNQPKLLKLGFNLHLSL